MADAAPVGAEGPEFAESGPWAVRACYRAMDWLLEIREALEKEALEKEALEKRVFDHASSARAPVKPELHGQRRGSEYVRPV